MRNASETMYKIGRIFSFILLGISALLIVIYSILMIVAAVDGRFPAYLGSVVGYSIWLVLVLVVILLASRAIKAIEQDKKDNGPHITMIVFGALSGDIFYLLGGIFGLIANGTEEEKKEVVEEQQVEKVEPVEEPKKEEQQGQDFKRALVGFILAVVGFGFACGWWLGLIGTGLGIASLIVNRPTEKQPFKTFSKIAKPVAIVDIILGAVVFIIAIVVVIVAAVAAAVEAGAAA